MWFNTQPSLTVGEAPHCQHHVLCVLTACRLALPWWRQCCVRVTTALSQWSVSVCSPRAAATHAHSLHAARESIEGNNPCAGTHTAVFACICGGFVASSYSLPVLLTTTCPSKSTSSLSNSHGLSHAESAGCQRMIPPPGPFQRTCPHNAHGHPCCVYATCVVCLLQ